MTGMSFRSSRPLPRALEDFPDSPHDLYLNHLAMIDHHVQYGKAKILITLALDACATTWSEVIMQQRDATTCRVLGDNPLELLHIATDLDQLRRSYLFNTSGFHKNRNPLVVFETNSGSSCVSAWAYRFEHQEGKRGRPRQRDPTTVLGCHTCTLRSGPQKQLTEATSCSSSVRISAESSLLCTTRSCAFSVWATLSVTAHRCRQNLFGMAISWSFCRR